MSNRLQRHPAPPAFLSELGRHEAPQNSPSPARAVWQGVIASLARWLDEQRERRGSVTRLRHLNDWMLRDIGIDRDDIEANVDRGLWELRLQQAPRTGREIHRGL
ncbi:DUF1127 domain-containing protein [Hypericibacter sp.]|uniref:DUF1127 domain-containing protein n=1 Tax=Hypericibacter sp. TaxID=2705401 RepID=UPI003D6D442D